MDLTKTLTIVMPAATAIAFVVTMFFIVHGLRVGIKVVEIILAIAIAVAIMTGLFFAADGIYIHIATQDFLRALIAYRVAWACTVFAIMFALVLKAFD